MATWSRSTNWWTSSAARSRSGPAWSRTPNRPRQTSVPIGPSAEPDHRVVERADGLLARYGGDPAFDAALLSAIAPQLPLPVPEVVAVESDHLVMTRIPGVALLHLPRPERRAFAAELLEFVAVVHSLEVDVPVDDTPLEAWLEEARLGHLAVPGPPAPPVFIHGDLGAEHIFVADGRITGVIDWSDAAIGDPALDHGRLMRDFGIAGDERARLYAICTALEDLAYGREPYVANATAALAELGPL